MPIQEDNSNIYVHKKIKNYTGYTNVSMPFILRKKIFEVVPILQVEQDLSIANAGNIKYFSFPTEQTGYAADDSPYIYKTTDGGKSWLKLNVGAGGSCRGLEFFDNQNGLCQMGNSIYATSNGGQSWVYKASGTLAGITTDNKGVVIGSCGYNSCGVMVSANQGQSFTSAGNIKVDGDLSFAKVTNTKVYILGTRTKFENIIYGLDLNTKQNVNLLLSGVTAYDDLYDIFENESLSIIVGNRGQILENNYGYNRAYYGHTYEYFTVAGYQDLAVAAGNRTVSVNIDFNGEGKWSELLDANGNSFKHSFYRVKFIDQSRFYIGGNNGLIWVAKL